ncbi:hypothetical protein [Wolbachia endosymbiont (group A) of Brachyopa scutellaris]|uniref:hypothetical protein n=1 Tax=Wolbachia endosymbiont (group A) of Brachyopa scutellaris TaxID=3066140 RepID=UPI003132B087
MPKNDQNEESTSILAKVGNAASKVGSFLGRGAKALGWGIIYPIRPKNWFKSWDEMWHDIKNGGRHIINNLPEEYNPPIETTQASKNLGVQITEQKKGTGKVSFLASRTLTGDIPYLSPEQLDKIKKDLPNVTIFREENKIVIEVDVKKIIEDIKTDSKNKGKSPEEIKKLALQGIADSINGDLKKLAGITGGEFKIHTDLKLLNGIAEKLYKEYDNQKQSSDKVVKSDVGQPSETIASGEKKWAQEAIKAGKSQSCGMQK